MLTYLIYVQSHNEFPAIRSGLFHVVASALVVHSSRVNLCKIYANLWFGEFRSATFLHTLPSVTGGKYSQVLENFVLPFTALLAFACWLTTGKHFQKRGQGTVSSVMCMIYRPTRMYDRPQLVDTKWFHIFPPFSWFATFFKKFFHKKNKNIKEIELH